MNCLVKREMVEAKYTLLLFIKRLKNEILAFAGMTCESLSDFYTLIRQE